MNKLTLQEIEQWMSHYYEDPHPEYVPQAIEGLSNEKVLGDVNSAKPIVYFFCFVFRANPNKIIEWTSSFIANLPLSEKQVIITSLWLSDTQSANNYLRRLATSTPELREFINDLTSKPLLDIDQIPIDQPDILDALWAAFMATGAENYLLRIISSLENYDNQRDDIKHLIGNAAKWSLKSNAMSHSQIKMICIAQLTQQPPKIAAILQDIIEGTEEEKE